MKFQRVNCRSGIQDISDDKVKDIKQLLKNAEENLQISKKCVESFGDIKIDHTENHKKVRSVFKATEAIIQTISDKLSEIKPRLISGESSAKERLQEAKKLNNDCFEKYKTMLMNMIEKQLQIKGEKVTDEELAFLADQDEYPQIFTDNYTFERAKVLRVLDFWTHQKTRKPEKEKF